MGEARSLQLGEHAGERWRKVFLGGPPKSAGKTTFALTAPGTKLVLMYDLGGVHCPPGVEASSIYVRQYEPADPVMLLNTDRWQHATNVGEAVIRDVASIRGAFLGLLQGKGDGLITFSDGATCPLPETLILDGMTELPQIIVDWVLGVNKKTDPDEFIGEGGRPNYYKLWTKRLEVVRALLHSVIPLPCNVILVGWESPEMVMQERQQHATGRIIPDIGGKLDNLTPGKVDASLRCYAKFGAQVSYMVQCAPDGVRDWVGIRGLYNAPKEVDCTMLPGDKRPLPWNRVFGPPAA